ncbi:MAG: adenylate/guanylate cyclase domain-containing protein [bacterium]|nr:adenylate/guanylate cyclase domain-containing protein [bacterium]
MRKKFVKKVIPAYPEDYLKISYSGALLFLDISGFTALSESLGSKGKEGTEKLTEIINVFFNGILNIIKDSSGEVVWFAGDGILIKFTDKDNSDNCAQKIIRLSSDYKLIKTKFGDFSLSLKICICKGSWSEHIFKTDEYPLLFLSGNLLKELSRLSNIAKPGEILKKELPVSKYSQLTESEKKSKKKISFFSDHLLKTSFTTQTGEHRPGSCLFLKLFGYSEDNPDIVLLSEVFNNISSIIKKYQGYILLIDSVRDEGCTVLCTFGAPLSFGDDAVHSLLAAEEILIRTKQVSKIKLQAGIDFGFVYSGLTGNNWKKQYTVLGDIINTSARLVNTINPGEIVVSENVMKKTSSSIQFKNIKATKVKGKSNLLKRFLFMEKKELHGFKYDFIGREKELSFLTENVKGGKPVIVVEGDAGIGKSRLLSQFMNLPSSSKYEIFSGTTDSIKPVFYLFSSMIAKKAGFNLTDPDEIKKDLLEKYIVKLIKRYFGRELTQDELNGNDLFLKISFLGTMLFGLEYKDSLYSQLTPVNRKLNLFEGLNLFFTYHKERLLLLFEDLHFAKTNDLEAILYLYKNLVLKNNLKASIILTTRPGFNYSLFPNKDDVKILHLKGLERSSVGNLIDSILNGFDLDKEIQIQVVSKAGNNPFYLEQILLYIIEKGIVELKDGRWVKNEKIKIIEIPEDIFSMVLSRIDSLEEKVKETLRAASVIGINFKQVLLSSVLKKIIKDELSISNKFGLTYFNDIKNLEYIFSHIIIKDIIYDSMLRERRRRLHLSIGKTIEKIYSKSIQENASVLAYHFGEAEEWNKAATYHYLAGKMLQDNYMLNESDVHLKKIEDLYNENKITDKKVYLSALIRRGGYLKIIGKINESLNLFQTVEKEAKDYINLRTKALHSIADIELKAGRMDNALKLENDIYKLNSGRSIENIIERIGVNVGKGWISCLKGDFNKSIKYLENSLKKILHLEKTKRKIPKESMRQLLSKKAEAYNDLGIIYYSKKIFMKSLQYLTKSLNISKKLNQKESIWLKNANLTLLNLTLGRIETVKKLLVEQETLAREIGDKLGIAKTHQNKSDLHLILGDYTLSIEEGLMALKLYRELGMNLQIIGNMINLSFRYRLIKNFDIAFKYLNDAKILIKEQHLENNFQHILGEYIFLYHDQGNMEELEKLLKSNEDIFKKMSNPDFDNLNKIIKAEIELKNGNPKKSLDLVNSIKFTKLGVSNWDLYKLTIPILIRLNLKKKSERLLTTMIKFSMKFNSKRFDNDIKILQKKLHS